MTRRMCALCPKGEPCAIMYVAEEQNLAVHQDCLLFSSGFVEGEEQNTEDLDKRFDVVSVMKEIKRGKKLMCYFCHKSGATIGCEVKHCRRSYHYFCALCDDASVEIDEKEGLYRYIIKCFLKPFQENPIYAHHCISLSTERIEFLKKCKQAGLLNEIFEEMLNTLHLAQEKLMEDNTPEAGTVKNVEFSIV
uniref:PHD finger protein 11 n=1 Tax=Pseudonaja textilis TaxID=8673 RepID=A0A670XTK1_PSETE